MILAATIVCPRFIRDLPASTPTPDISRIALPLCNGLFKQEPERRIYCRLQIANLDVTELLSRPLEQARRVIERRTVLEAQV